MVEPMIKITDEQRANVIEWIEALESGDYAQGTGGMLLVSDIGPEHCCLGVASVVAGVPHDESVASSFASFYYGQEAAPRAGSWEALKYNTHLPDGEWFQDRFGFSFNDQLAWSGETLYHMNDTGKSFADIAKALRRHVFGK